MIRVWAGAAALRVLAAWDRFRSRRDLARQVREAGR